MTEQFVCCECNCIDLVILAPKPINNQWYCSLHHPQSLKWHGEFPRELYNPETDIICNRPSGIGLS